MLKVFAIAFLNHSKANNKASIEFKTSNKGELNKLLFFGLKEQPPKKMFCFCAFFLFYKLLYLLPNIGTFDFAVP